MTDNNIINWEDVDPLTLEPVKDSICIWYYKMEGKTYAYDAFAWLDWLCFTDDYYHPMFRVPLTHKDNHNIYEAVKNFLNNTEKKYKEMEKLIDICESHSVNIDFVKNEQEARLKIIPKSPVLKLNIISSTNKFNNSLNTPIKCSVHLVYNFIDVYGNKSKIYNKFL